MAGGDELTPGEPEIGDEPDRGCGHGGTGEVELGPLERRQGGPDFRVVPALRTELLARLLELRLGLAQAGLRALELALRLVGPRLGVDLALDQLEDPAACSRVWRAWRGRRDRA